MQKSIRQALVVTVFAALIAGQGLAAAQYDVRTAMEASVNGFVPTPSVWSVSAHTQNGADGFWYRWNSTLKNWWTESGPAVLTLDAGGPTAYDLLGYAANDTRGYKHGWVREASAGAPGYVGNIIWDDSDAGIQAGEVQIGVTNNSQNGGNPILVEWKATSAGTYEVEYTLRDANSGARWQAHLLTWDSTGNTWENHTYVTQIGAGTQTLSLLADLAAGDSIVLYTTMLNDAAGSQLPLLSGGVSLSIPEPASLGLFLLGGLVALRRRGRGVQEA